MSCCIKFPIASSKAEGADHYLLGLCMNLFRFQIRLSHMHKRQMQQHRSEGIKSRVHKGWLVVQSRTMKWKPLGETRPWEQSLYTGKMSNGTLRSFHSQALPREAWQGGEDPTTEFPTLSFQKGSKTFWGAWNSNNKFICCKPSFKL